ncbi:hypothetical protein CPC08DRAFT_702095 [Agrocybe pediades]|nr:hypothetical protein CPC08DRAFT_702095 [Agrocybe pediades]
MCYSAGSIDQAVSPCPMCKLFPQRKCPHTRETCRNRSAHPRMDVQYLTNAEVECFNGCGFCKWANLDPTPPAKTLGYNNTGWPGCCRAPRPDEYHLIQPEDWQAVSIVYRVPIPPHIDALFTKNYPSSTALASPTSPSNRAASSKPSLPTSTRKNVRGSPSSKPSVLSAKVASTPSPSRGRSSPPGSSGGNISRSSSSNAVSSSVPSSSSMDTIRRKAGNSERRLDTGTQSSQSSPSRKSVDLERSSSPRRVVSTSVRRPALTPATTSVSVSKVVAADSRSSASHDSPSKRRPSISGAATQSTPSQAPRGTDRSAPPPRNPKKDEDCGASTSSGSSDGFGSVSDSTVTSDGGFTDYLSDESEAELQRQAEAKAAVLAQSLAEEYEFKMARQQLAHIDLRPPGLWNPNNNTPAKLST